MVDSSLHNLKAITMQMSKCRKFIPHKTIQTLKKIIMFNKYRNAMRQYLHKYFFNFRSAFTDPYRPSDARRALFILKRQSENKINNWRLLQGKPVVDETHMPNTIGRTPHRMSNPFCRKRF